MTATKAVLAELNRFLRSKESQVLCVTGDWGVGKTYTWNELVERQPKMAK